MNIPRYEIFLYGNPESQPVLILQGNRYTETGCYSEIKKIMTANDIGEYDSFPTAVQRIIDAVGDYTADNTCEFLHNMPTSCSFSGDCGFHVLGLWLIAKDKELNSECIENEALYP